MKLDDSNTHSEVDDLCNKKTSLIGINEQKL